MRCFSFTMCAQNQGNNNYREAFLFALHSYKQRPTSVYMLEHKAEIAVFKNSLSEQLGKQLFLLTQFYRRKVLSHISGQQQRQPPLWTTKAAESPRLVWHVSKGRKTPNFFGATRSSDAAVKYCPHCAASLRLLILYCVCMAFNLTYLFSSCFLTISFNPFDEIQCRCNFGTITSPEMNYVHVEFQLS